MTVVSPRNLHPASRQGSSDVGLTAAVTLFAALLVTLVTQRQHRCRPRRAVPRVRAPRADLRAAPSACSGPASSPTSRICSRTRPSSPSARSHSSSSPRFRSCGSGRSMSKACCPPSYRSRSAVVVASIANYWGHRLTHEVPFLWRFHAVHHSIELMDWAAAARLHPIDSAFTQAFTVLPLLLLGYDAGVFASIAVFVTLLAHLPARQRALAVPGCAVGRQHAGVAPLAPRTRSRSSEQELRSARRRQAVRDRVPPEGPATGGVRRRGPGPGRGYLAHLAYPFTGAAQPPARPALLHEAFE